MKVLIITNMYPNKELPAWGTFVADQVKTLNQFVSTNVIARLRHSGLGYLSFFLRTLCSLFNGNYNIIHTHYGFHSTLIPLLFSSKPIVTTFHGSDALIEPQRNRIYNYLQRKVVARSNHIIAVSDQIKERLIKDLGANPNKVTVIPCGVDTKRYRHRDKEQTRLKLGVPTNKKIALFIGRLTHRKGVDLIQEAARSLKDVDFYFIGAGPLKWQAPNCKFIGIVDHKNIPEWMNIADMLLLPSLSEGTPVCILEALASEIPVVCSTVGACSKLVSDGVTGYLIPPGNAEALTKAIHTASLNNTFDMLAGRKKMVEEYDLDHIAKKLYTLYRELPK